LNRVARLFDVELTSFERKCFANLSHKPNKAMNLNSYLSLLGGNFREVEKRDGLHLESVAAAEASLSVRDADFVITLDADSLLSSDYALRLVDWMCRPGHERVAVAQTPYSAVPGATQAVERIAGATTDIQHLIHQGFTRYDGTYWVGANAVLRRSARPTNDVPQEESSDSSRCLGFAGWRFDPTKRTLHNPDGALVALTTGEFDLLAAFLQRPTRVLNRDQLLDLVRGQEWSPLDRSIDTQVGRLRKKIERDPANPDLIKTVRGVGYVFAIEVEIL